MQTIPIAKANVLCLTETLAQTEFMFIAVNKM